MRSGFLRPDMNGFRMIREYFLACRGKGNFPPRNCGSLFISLTVEANGDIKPCFFLPPFANINELTPKAMKDIMTSEHLAKVRQRYRNGDINECRRCVQPYSADL
jgi:radical SAM protein with 4Fe4S-binding SPASM domain